MMMISSTFFFYKNTNKWDVETIQNCFRFLQNASFEMFFLQKLDKKLVQNSKNKEQKIDMFFNGQK